MHGSKLQRVQVVDSHTAGEPTRVVIEGGPDLGTGDLNAKRALFQERYADFRSAVISEPRGSEVRVGALLLEPVDPSCAAGVIFFNNVGCLQMCGHGTLGIVATLAHLGRIDPGAHRIETPAGVVTASLHASGEISLRNVASYRYARDVRIAVDGYGEVAGDVAWGGNWFFLTQAGPERERALVRANIDNLLDYAWRIRETLALRGITGRDGAEIDHIELCGPPQTPGARGRNFVLCPGKAYDRSPCGTGTSAYLACLYADGKLAAGEEWRQESIVGSLFTGTIVEENGALFPTIRGRAYVNAEATLLLNPDDPYCWGIPCDGQASRVCPAPETF